MYALFANLIYIIGIFVFVILLILLFATLTAVY